MIGRSALALSLAMLSWSISPATAWSQRALPAEENDRQADDRSPVLRFAAAADHTKADLAGSKRRAKKSVLEPSSTRWLEDDDQQPSAGKGKAASANSAALEAVALEEDLSPPELLSPDNGPPPELMPEDGPPLPGVHPLPAGSDFAHALSATPLETIPYKDLRKQPMMRDSWLYRPFNVSIFEGALFAAPPLQMQSNTAVSYFTGFRLGWDFNSHFGGETRFGFSKVFLLDVTQNTQIGYQQIFYFDSDVLIYPWGDTRWRPYLSLGTGMADILIAGFNGAPGVPGSGGVRFHPSAFNLPMGFGIKFRLGPRMAFRADFRDNLTFSGAGGLRTLNNIETVGGVEIHFGGGNRRSYWPWNPSHHWW